MLENVLTVLHKLRAERLIDRWAIGGAVAFILRSRAFDTEDLDIFIALPATNSLLLSLSPIYASLEAQGFSVSGAHVTIHGEMVQLLPAPTPLVEEALNNAQHLKVGRAVCPVFQLDHLIAIALQLGRGKDKQRVRSLLEEGYWSPTPRFLEILDRHGLRATWGVFQRTLR